MDEDLLVQPLQRGARVDAEFVAQTEAEVLIAGQRVGLSSYPVKTEHPSLLQLLAQRVLNDRRFGLANRRMRSPQRKLAVDECFLGHKAAFVEARRNGGDEFEVGKVGKHLATPQRQTAAQIDSRGVSGARGQKSLASFRGPLEHNRVHRFERDRQPVAPVFRRQDLARRTPAAFRFEKFAKVKDVGLDCGDRTIRRMATPQHVGKLIDRCAAIARDEQPCQDRALLSATQHEFRVC